MFGLSIGVSNIGDILPRAVYALLSGLNAATVGIIALAAVELSDKAITDQATRLVLSITAMAGILYNALWYFPVLIVAGGCCTIVYDFRWLHRPVRAVKNGLLRMRRGRVTESENIQGAENGTDGNTNDSRIALAETAESGPREDEPRVVPQEYRLNFSWRSEILISDIADASLLPGNELMLQQCHTSVVPTKHQAESPTAVRHQNIVLPQKPLQ